MTNFNVCWYSYDEITARLDWLAKNHPSVVTLEDVGKTHEGRRITLVKIGRKDTNRKKSEDRKAVWIDSG